MYKELKKAFDALQDDLSRAYFIENIKISMSHSGKGMDINYLSLHPGYAEFSSGFANRDRAYKK